MLQNIILHNSFRPDILPVAWKQPKEAALCWFRWLNLHQHPLFASAVLVWLKCLRSLKQKKKNVFCIHLHSFQCFLAKMRKETPIPVKVFNSALFIKWRREKKSLGPEIKMWKYSNAVKISRVYSLLKAKRSIATHSSVGFWTENFLRLTRWYPDIFPITQMWWTHFLSIVYTKMENLR